MRNTKLRIGNRIIFYNKDNTIAYQGIIKHIGSRYPNDGYDDNCIWSTWDRLDGSPHLTYVRLTDLKYRIINPNQRPLHNWF